MQIRIYHLFAYKITDFLVLSHFIVPFINRHAVPVKLKPKNRKATVSDVFEKKNTTPQVSP